MKVGKVISHVYSSKNRSDTEDYNFSTVSFIT